MQLNRSLKMASSLVLLAVFLWLGTNASFYNEALISAFFALALASVVLIHFRVRPSGLDGLLVLGCAALLAVVDFRWLHFKPAIVSWLSFAGFSSLFVLGLRTVWSEAKNQRLLFLAFIPAALFVGSEYFADSFLQWTSAIQPKVLDLYLYSFDGSLHLQLPFLLGQAFAKSSTLLLTGELFYIGLAIPIAMVYVGRLLRIGDKALPSFLAFLATGPVGIVFYNLFPALGPAHVFTQEFPWHPLSISEISRLYMEPISVVGARNAIPSLHMAWVLLVWWYSRGLSWWERLIAFLFLVFTVLATMGTGEHYFVDLVVAFPFAVFVKAVFTFDLPPMGTRRGLAILFGVLTTLAWFGALRYLTSGFWISPALPWAACALTVGVSLIIESRLQAAPNGLETKAIVANPPLEILS